MKGFYWALADKDNQSEIKRTFRVAFGLFGPMEWPIGSGRFRGRGFRFYVNTPWACISVSWNLEEQNHDFLRDGLTFCWGRNKGWSHRDSNGRVFYRHYSTLFSRLKLNPTCNYVDDQQSRLGELNRMQAF